MNLYFYYYVFTIYDNNSFNSALLFPKICKRKVAEIFWQVCKSVSEIISQSSSVEITGCNNEDILLSQIMVYNNFVLIFLHIQLQL